MDPSLTNGKSLSIVSVLDGAGQTDGSVHTEVHLLQQLQQGNVGPYVHTCFFKSGSRLSPHIFGNISHLTSITAEKFKFLIANKDVKEF